jgi:hypothetical protein
MPSNLTDSCLFLLMQLSVISNIQLIFCLEVLDLDRFAHVARIQNGWFKPHVVFPDDIEKVQIFLMVVLCSLLDCWST